MHVTHSKVVFWADAESKCWPITQVIICHQQSWTQTHNTEHTSSLLLPRCLSAWAEARCDPTSAGATQMQPYPEGSVNS